MTETLLRRGRLFSTGGYTMFVSLPADWLREMDLKKGEEVEILVDDARRIIIVPVKREVEQDAR
jgi:antitoxin component of MazEF toxin-antitoxin module